MAYIGTSPSNGVRRIHTYTATAGQTTFTGSSTEGVTLTYADTNYIDVFQNGVLLGSADYTSTSGTSVVLVQGASVDDLVVIVVYDVFSVADTVSKTAGGTFDGNITAAGTLGVTGVPTFTGRSVHSGGITVANDGQIGSVGDADAMAISSGGVVTFSQPPVNVGVSNLQIFRINQNIDSTTSPTTLTDYTDAHGTNTFQRIGTAWSLSSGVFTPSTSGVYEIMFVAAMMSNAASRYIQFDYHFSTNSGSAYTIHTMYAFVPFIGSNNTFGEFNFPRYYNISNPSTFRFFVKYSSAASMRLRGAGTNDVSYLLIKRIADAQ